MDKKTFKKKKNIFSSIFAKLMVLAVIIYLLTVFISGQMEVATYREELAATTQQVDLLATQNQELQRLMASQDQGAYIERIAREKLGYAYPDERIFVDMYGQ